MQIKLNFELRTRFYQLEDARQAEQRAKETSQTIYCWKALGRSNWLESGFSISDVLGLVVLPKGLPDQIEMPDDIEI
jgi:hypothetical protein